MAREYSFFSDEEKLFLKENYLFLSDARLGTIFNRSEANIRKARQLLGLKRRGTNVKDVLASTPIVIWFPRKAFEGEEVDFKQLKLQKEKNE